MSGNRKVKNYPTFEKVAYENFLAKRQNAQCKTSHALPSGNDNVIGEGSRKFEIKMSESGIGISYTGQDTRIGICYCGLRNYLDRRSVKRKRQRNKRKQAQRLVGLSSGIGEQSPDNVNVITGNDNSSHSQTLLTVPNGGNGDHGTRETDVSKNVSTETWSWKFSGPDGVAVSSQEYFDRCPCGLSSFRESIIRKRRKEKKRKREKEKERKKREKEKRAKFNASFHEVPNDDDAKCDDVTGGENNCECFFCFGERLQKSFDKSYKLGKCKYYPPDSEIQLPT